MSGARKGGNFSLALLLGTRGRELFSRPRYSLLTKPTTHQIKVRIKFEPLPLPIRFVLFYFVKISIVYFASIKNALLEMNTVACYSFHFGVCTLGGSTAHLKDRTLLHNKINSAT